MFKKTTFINGLCLLIFLVLTLSINFLHTETKAQGQNDCPACHFQNSTLTTAQVSVISLPQLRLLEILRLFESLAYEDIHLITPSSRSPPSA